jgi:hypothetical protein
LAHKQYELATKHISDKMPRGQNVSATKCTGDKKYERQNVPGTKSISDKKYIGDQPVCRLNVSGQSILGPHTKTYPRIFSKVSATNVLGDEKYRRTLCFIPFSTKITEAMASSQQLHLKPSESWGDQNGYKSTGNAPMFQFLVKSVIMQK